MGTHSREAALGGEENEDLMRGWDAALPQVDGNKRPGPEPSPATTYIREHYVALMKFKAARGLGWPEMAQLFNRLGYKPAKSGLEFTANTIAGLFHQERARLDPKARKKRAGTKTDTAREKKPARVQTEQARLLTEEPAPSLAPIPAVTNETSSPKPDWVEAMEKQKREKEATAPKVLVQHKPGMR